MKFRQYVNKSAAFLTILAIMVGGCTACSENSSSSVSGENVAMEDLPYGATMRESSEYAFTLEYDKRYFEDGELAVLVDYYDAVQNEDAELCTASIPDFYLQYILDNVYGGLFDASAFVAQQKDAFRECAEGSDFKFYYMQVQDCQELGGEEAGIETLMEMFDSLQGEGYCDEHLQSCKSLKVQLMLSTGEDTFVSNNLRVFLVNLDGTYYVCP